MTQGSTLTLFLVAALPAAAAAGTETFDAGMKPVLEQYLKIHAALAGDSTTGVEAAAEAMAKAVGKVDATNVTGEHAKHYVDIPAKLVAAANQVASAGDIEAMRSKLKALSRPMAMWATMSEPRGISVVFCSMAKASWVQKAGPIRNPYYGAKMLTCGEVVGGGGPMKE